MRQNPTKSDFHDTTAKLLEQRLPAAPGSIIEDGDDSSPLISKKPKAETTNGLRGPFDFFFAGVTSIILWILLVFLVIQLFR